ncbi:unnamed protein product [Oreochromis niloticus]|nr:unnamed protein product [Mustela putorius furo]
MLGELGQNNCSLEITDVRNHDNGPFCFRVELVRTENNDPTKDMFSFVEDCVELNMLSIENYNHIIIPAVVGIGTALLFGIFCIFMAKKYKNRIAELQNQEGTMWNRLSRLSRR